jgi:hypothetical protein
MDASLWSMVADPDFVWPTEWQTKRDSISTSVGATTRLLRLRSPLAALDHEFKSMPMRSGTQRRARTKSCDSFPRNRPVLSNNWGVTYNFALGLPV